MPPIMFMSNFPFSYARWSSTPMINVHHHCNNGNNSWMNMWALSMMLKEFGQMFRKPEKQPPIPYAYNPYQQYTNPMYPYLNLNNGQYPYAPTQEVDEDLTSLQKAYKGKHDISDIIKINDKYIAITKDGHRIKAEDAETLMDKIDEYAEGKGKGKVEKKTKVEGDTDSDSDVDLDTDTDTDTDADNDIDTDTDGKSAVRRGKVPQGWGKAQSFLDHDAKHPSAIHGRDNEFCSNRQRILHAKNNPAEETVNLLLENYNVTINKEKHGELKQAIIDANPSIYNEDGKLNDGVNAETLNKKLDLPSEDILKKDYKATKKTVISDTSHKKSTKGKVKNNVMVDGITYSQGIEWESGNKLYKNQEGSWSDTDRDAVLLINSKKYKIYPSETHIQEAVDYGELIGASSYWFRGDPIFDTTKCEFRGDYKARYRIKIGNNNYANIYAKNGTTYININNKEYNMNELMAGNITPSPL